MDQNLTTSNGMTMEDHQAVEYYHTRRKNSKIGSLSQAKPPTLSAHKVSVESQKLSSSGTGCKIATLDEFTFA